MLDAILYHSVCGHTKKYALALSERLNVPAYSLKEAKKKLSKGSSVLFMSWICEDQLVRFERLIRYQVVAAIGVGIMPKTLEYTEKIKNESFLYCPFFYLRGGIRRKKLSFFKRLSLRSIANDLSFKLLEKRIQPEEVGVLDAILHDLDYSDISDLNEFLNWYDQKSEQENWIA